MRKQQSILNAEKSILSTFLWFAKYWNYGYDMTVTLISIFRRLECSNTGIKKPSTPSSALQCSWDALLRDRGKIFRLYISLEAKIRLKRI